MPDGTSAIDGPPRHTEPRITIPAGRFESPSSHDRSRGLLQTYFDAFLTRPERLGADDTGKKLGSFLADKEYIKGVNIWRGSWGYSYQSDSKTILTPDLPMPSEQYDYFVFRLGADTQTGQHLWPNPDEMDQYRFLHEVNHGYQEYLMDQQGGNNWHDRAVRGAIDSHLAKLFQYCYQSRTNNPGRGMSTWGNQPDYNSVTDIRSQNAVRAIEDANELVTMYLWHPQYLTTYLRYLSVQIPGYSTHDLAADRLTPISTSDAGNILSLIGEYVEEMKKTIR